MDKGTSFGSVLSIFGTAGGIVTAILMAWYPQWMHWILYSALSVCLLSLLIGVAILSSPPLKRKEVAMAGKPEGPVGISFENCRNVLVKDSRGEGLGTFIRARNSEDLNIHRNKSDNTNIFMDIDGIKGLTATENQHNGDMQGKQEKSAGTTQRKGLRRYFSGWRPEENDDTA